MPREYITELKKWIAEVVRQSSGGEFVGMNRVVDLISKNFAVQAHEVAILTITPDDRFLRFVVPEKLQHVGQIPLTSTNSLAARTVREKRPEVINHFAVVPHSSVFEAVPIVQEERGEPIQKIMSVAITLERKIIGVLQISRKGKTAAEAGPDFTHSQLRELKTVADTLAPCVPLLALARV
jgi:transcriptional regulator with GAF, ATPase, and Fis domain